MSRIIKKAQGLISIVFTRQFFKYVFVGILNTGIFYGIYYVMLKLGCFYALAATVGTIVGIINGYVWNKFFTFKSKKKSVSETLRFLAVYGVQYLSNLLIIFLCVNYVDLSEELAGLVALSIGVFIGYFGHRFWSFREN